MKSLIFTLGLGLLAITSATPALAQQAKANKGKLTIQQVEAQVVSLQGMVTTLQGQNTTLQTQVTTLQNSLNAQNAQNAFALGQFVSVQNGTIRGLGGPHIIFKGVNVHIENGLTPGDSANGLGNLIVGFDDDGFDSLERDANDIDAARTGSHNLVVGDDHEFTASNGFVAGEGNVVSADYAAVSGGVGNTASAFAATVTGGEYNLADEVAASVSGGASNIASGTGAVVSGGLFNMASGIQSSVGGGNHQTEATDLTNLN